MTIDEINDVSGQTVDAAMHVHTILGPGLLESAYEACLAHELRKRGLRAQTQMLLPVVYDGAHVEAAYRADMVVEDAVLIELKAIGKVLPIHLAQLLSYLRLSEYRVGLLFNFHVLHLRDGIIRLVNNL